MHQFFSNLFRRKLVSTELTRTPLNRCLSLAHVLFYSIGSVVGIGAYALTGQLVHHIAGPATIITFVLSGIAVSLSALCYAEFAARVPRAGSAYIYSYIALGELPAFMVGWNTLFELTVALGVGAGTFSAYLDNWTKGWITHTTQRLLGSKYLSAYADGWFASQPDVLAVIVILVFTVLVCVGIKQGVTVQAIIAVTNLTVMVFTVIVGLCAGADVSLWKTQSTNRTHHEQTHPGGFMPFGFAGVLSGTAASVFVYTGFESVAALAEETKDPKRTIPISIISTMLVAVVLFMLMSLTLSLTVPYTLVDPESAFVDMFLRLNLPWAARIVTIGACAAIVSLLIVTMCAVPRYIYAMAIDGLMFRCLAHVNQRTQVPIRATIIMSLVVCILLLLFNLTTLVEFTAIGTLIAFTLTAMSSLLLRYRHPSELHPPDQSMIEFDDNNETQSLKPDHFATPPPSYDAIGSGSDTSPESIVTRCLLVYTASCAVVCVCTRLHNYVWLLVLLVFYIINGIAITISCVVIGSVRQYEQDIDFAVPLSPWLQLLSVAVNILFLIYLNPLTWVRFVFWLIIGFAIYFGYSYRNSSEHRTHSVDVSHNPAYNRIH